MASGLRGESSDVEEVLGVPVIVSPLPLPTNVRVPLGVMAMGLGPGTCFGLLSPLTLPSVGGVIEPFTW